MLVESKETKINLLYMPINIHPIKNREYNTKNATLVALRLLTVYPSGTTSILASSAPGAVE